METGIIKAVCISAKRGTAKQNVNRAVLQEGFGLAGDAHGGDWHRQVSLLSYDKVVAFNEQGGAVSHGDFGENILVQGIDLRQLPVGTLLHCGDALLEVTQIGKACHNHCQIYHRVGDCIMPREGIFARVLKGGEIAVGDIIAVSIPEEIALRAAVITLSDKGFKGERKDESGPLTATMLQEVGYTVAAQHILPDDQTQLEELLVDLADRQQMDLILTTGGTGFSRRDVTPEATLAVAERVAPGIAEAMRAHSLQITGRAMLSRAVSVIRGGTLIVNLPGSPKAAKENLEYILPQLKHGLEILRGDAFDCAVSTK